MAVNTSRLIVAALLIGMVSGVQYACAQPMATASVDSSQVRVNEPFQISVTAQGGRIAEPVIPHADGLRFDRSPSLSSSSTQISFVNGQSAMVTKREWGFRAWATREGALTIPPISVRIDGKNCMTEAIPVTAAAASSSPPQALDNTVQTPPQSQPNTSQSAEKGTPTVEDALILETSVNKKRVYQGELITLSLRIMQLDLPGLSASYAAGPSIPLPDTEGFYQGPINKLERQESRKGWTYDVVEHRMPLYPTGTGTFKIGAWNWEGYIQWFSRVGPQRQYHTVTTEPIEIEVVPLPDRPANFSGGVGRFTVKASLLNGDVTQGVPTQLQVRITGEGNPDSILAPTLPPIPWAHVSDAEISPSAPGADWSKIEKVFTYNITPLEPGNQAIPAIDFCYFSPDKGQFITEKVDSFSVFVRPSGEGQKLVTVGGTEAQQEKQVEIIGEDVLPILTEAAALRPFKANRFTMPLLFALPPALSIAFLVFLHRKRRLENDSAYARRYYAHAKTQKRLQTAAESDAPSEEIYHALIGYLADHFGVSEAGMTSSDARSLLEANISEPDLADNIVKVLRTCERAQYGDGKLQPEEVQALLRGTESSIDRIEALSGKGVRR